MRFGRLILLRKIAGTKWLCRCDCGTETEARTDHFRSGRKKSCGCLSREVTAARHLVHGHAAGRTATPEYVTWSSMKARCYNPKAARYADYGGRGITVCERWLHSFGNFLSDMGPRPPGASIGRVDGNANYEPGNCRWESDTEQARNKRNVRRIEFKGLTLTIQEWAERLGISHSSLWSRLKKGWPLERALTVGVISLEERARLAVDARQEREAAPASP